MITRIHLNSSLIVRNTKMLGIVKNRIKLLLNMIIISIYERRVSFEYVLKLLYIYRFVEGGNNFGLI